MGFLQLNDRGDGSACWLIWVLLKIIPRWTLLFVVFFGAFCLFSSDIRDLVKVSWIVFFPPIMILSISGLFLAKVIVGKYRGLPRLKNEAVKNCQILLKFNKKARCLVLVLIFMEMLMSVILNYMGLVLFVWLYDIILRGVQA